MNETQIALVQNSWTKVLPIADKAAGLFYDRLFELDPSVKPLFKGDMRRQGAMLMKTINLAVESLTDLESVVPAVKELGVRHVGYGVKDAHYDTVGEALLWTLEQGLGDDFTPETREAWAVTYGVLADTMKSAAKETEPA